MNSPRVSRSFAWWGAPVKSARHPQANDEDVATPVSDTLCAHEQTMAGSADAWAGLAYGTLCGGGGDAQLCGAQASRQCSVEFLSRWAAERTQPVAAKDASFGFDYVVPPLDEAARTALDQRALLELQALLVESEAVLSAARSGTRDCPNEDYDQIHANQLAAFEQYIELSARLRE